MKSKQAQKPSTKAGRQGPPLNVLMVEDSREDTALIIRHLEASGYAVHCQRVHNARTMEQALDHETWDVILCDYSLPSFAVVPAIEILRKKKLDLPFIVVSGTVGESVAVEVMKAGAHDFIVKDNLARLAPAIDRELREAKVRAQRTSDVEKLFYLAAIVDSTGEAIFSQNMDDVITTWNSGARELFGYTAEETIGQSAYLIVPDALKSATREVLAGLSRGEAVEPFETMRVRKDGLKIDVYLAISPIRRLDGQLVGASSIAYDITERKRIESERTKMIEQLNDTLSKVKTLSGLLPICASCKKIRDDRGYWQKLETFVHEHSNAEFSHSICPDCMERMYPDFSKRRE